MMSSFKTILTVLIFITGVHSGIAATPLDFDGDGTSDFAITRWRATATRFELDWYVARSADQSMLYAQWGIGVFSGAGDTPVPADYDGDNKTDIAVWRYPPNADNPAIFYILRSSDSTAEVSGFGMENDDVRAVGDYDGDGKADLAVYRHVPTFGGPGYFIYRGTLNNPEGGLTYVEWGKSSHPLKGDFDGDGKLDFCVRLATGQDFGAIWLLRSSDRGVEYIRWGLQNDEVQTGDHDADGKTDFFYRRTVNNNYEWYILERDGGGTGATPIRWGREDLMDTPIAGLDFDGDHRSDITVYRKMPSAANNLFIVRRSSDGGIIRFWWGTFNAADAAIQQF